MVNLTLYENAVDYLLQTLQVQTETNSRARQERSYSCRAQKEKLERCVDFADYCRVHFRRWY